MTKPSNAKHAATYRAKQAARVKFLTDQVAAIEKMKQSYLGQMRFCDIEALGYFREFVRRIDQALAPQGEK